MQNLALYDGKANNDTILHKDILQEKWNLALKDYKHVKVVLMVQ